VPLVDLQRAAGNRVVTRLLAPRPGQPNPPPLAPVVQRDIATDYQTEVDKRTAAGWARAAEILNGFNDLDIKTRVNGLTVAEAAAMRAQVQEWNHRVRAALLDRLYDYARSAGDWTDAAVQLSGFNDLGIDERVGQLGAGDVWPLYQGTLNAFTGPSQDRLIAAISRRHHETVSPASGTDAIRQLVTMKARGVAAGVASALVLGQLGLTVADLPQGQAPGQDTSTETLVKIVSSAIVGAGAAVIQEPGMLAEGKLAHTLIGAYYASMNQPTLVDPTIITIVRWAAKALSLTRGALDQLYRRLPEEVLENIKTRPDILDFGKLQVYEIKSDESAVRAVPEMEGYLEILDAIKIPGFGMFRPGSPANPGAEGTLKYGDGELVWCCPWPGAIVYKFNPRFAGKLKALAPSELKAQVLGEVPPPIGVETITALGVFGAMAVAALAPEAEAAAVVAAARALRAAAVSYETLIPLLVRATQSAGQAIPSLVTGGG
jgi:hypothetical protein